MPLTILWPEIRNLYHRYYANIDRDLVARVNQRNTLACNFIALPGPSKRRRHRHRLCQSYWCKKKKQQDN